MKTMTCIVCGREFETERHNQTICSSECRKEREKQLREKNKIKDASAETGFVVRGESAASLAKQIREHRRERLVFFRRRDLANAEAAANVPRKTIESKGRRIECRGQCSGCHSYSDHVLELSRWR